MKKEQGFSLIELLIVVAIIAIIAAIAVPSMLTSRMAANEAAAIQGLRTIGSAEVAYSAVNNQQYAELQPLVDGTFLDERFGDASAGFNGYIYALGAVTGAPAGSDDPPPGAFGFTATPTSPGSSGRYVYGIATDQVVRYQDNLGSGPDPVGLAQGDPIGKVAAGSGS